MSEIRQDLIDTIDKLCEDMATREMRVAAEQGQWPQALWQALDDIGLVSALLPEAAGGAGLDFGDAMAAVRRTAFHALPLPLGETLLASRLLMAAGLAVPAGALTVAPPGDAPLQVHGQGAQARLSGQARRVPWGDACPHVVVAAGAPGQEVLALVATEGRVVQVECNLAQEPRATLDLQDAPVLAIAPFEGAAERLRLEGALLRSVQMTGALERVLAYSLQYANDRVQFGKPIARFQAIQHMLALLAGHVAASSAISDAAVEASVDGADFFAVAAAKSRVGEAAGKSSEIAHQTHGAMGFTHEHNLHHSTRRLWAWREEFGNESHWQVRLGEMVARQGADALWPLLSAL